MKQVKETVCGTAAASDERSLFLSPRPIPSSNFAALDNAISQLATITDGTSNIATNGYVGLRRNSVQFGNGATQTNSFTGFRNEIASIQHKTSWTSTIVQMDYGYNKLHDRTYERFGGSGSSGDSFEHDKIRRLTKAWMGSSTPSSPSGNSFVKTIDYNYDDDGNRTRSTIGAQRMIVTLGSPSKSASAVTSSA